MSSEYLQDANMNFEKNVYHLIEDLQQFDYSMEGFDLLWNFIFPHKAGRRTIYSHISVTKYRDTYYVSHMNGDLCSLEVIVNQSVKEAESFKFSRGHGDFTKKWNVLISAARDWLKVVNKDWVKANRQV